MKRSRATCIASALALACVACSGGDPPAPKRSAYRYRPPVVHQESVAPGAVFTDVTAASGIDFVHVNGAAGKKLLPETMGSGVAMLDCDGDGDLDLLFAQSRPWAPEARMPTMRLFRNEGSWRFTDRTEGSGLDVVCYGMGLSVADYDADGDPDVYLTCLGENRLFNNRGDGTFEQVAQAPDGGSWIDEEGREHPSWSTGAAWFDADEDGDLDLLVVSYVRWTEKTDVYASVVAGTKAYTRPQLYTGDSPRLYLQEADHTFRDATAGSGFDATREPGKSLSVCVDDYDADGHLDVFVGNDTVQNFLFLGRGGGKFVETAVRAAIGYDDTGQARASMGLDAFDFRNDGRLTVAIGNFSEEPVSLYTVRRREGGLVFQDDAISTRIGTPTLLPLTFGLVACDLDLDGWCDLVLANGHIEPSITELKRELKFEQTPQYFRNVAGERFHDVSADAGPAFARRLVGRGLAAGDLDGDGDLDLVFTSNGGRPLVARNERAPQKGVLRLRLRQPGTANPDALGATVRVTAGGVTQRRAVRTGGSYLSQGELVLTFGLPGRTGQADEVEVRWPDGSVQRFGPLPGDPSPRVLERAE